MCYVLVRVWDLSNVRLIYHSLELLKLKSRREMHEGVRNTKIKKKKKKEYAYLFCRSVASVL